VSERGERALVRQRLPGREVGGTGGGQQRVQGGRQVLGLPGGGGDGQHEPAGGRRLSGGSAVLAGAALVRPVLVRPVLVRPVLVRFGPASLGPAGERGGEERAERGRADEVSARGGGQGGMTGLAVG
jgi:hypothetical protein